MNSRLDRKEVIWRRLVRFCIAYAIGWLVALIFHGLIASAYGYAWPEVSFLFRPDVRFTDWTISWSQSQKPNPYIGNQPGLAATYFPFSYLGFRALNGLDEVHRVLAFFLLTFVAVGCVWIWWIRKYRVLWQGDSRWPVATLMVFFIVACNYPLIFALDRGNIDPIVMGVVFISLELARAGRSTTGGLILAVGAAAKAFPFAAILFWVRRRRIFATAIALAGFLALIVLPTLAFEGDVASTLRAFRENMGEFRALHVLGRNSTHYSADWLDAAQILSRWNGKSLDMVAWVYWYEKAMLLIAALLSLLAVFVIREGWRELLAIVLIMLVFPNVANDYKLVFLVIPLLEWLTSETRGWRIFVFGVGAVLLLLPKHYYFPHPGDDASISCIINPTLVLLISTALWPTSYETIRVRSRIAEFRKRALRSVGEN